MEQSIPSFSYDHQREGIFQNSNQYIDPHFMYQQRHQELQMMIAQQQQQQQLREHQSQIQLNEEIIENHSNVNEFDGESQNRSM